MNAESKSKTKPCASCGEPVPLGCLLCVDCQRDNMRRYRESHPWLFSVTR